MICGILQQLLFLMELMEYQVFQETPRTIKICLNGMNLILKNGQKKLLHRLLCGYGIQNRDGQLFIQYY